MSLPKKAMVQTLYPQDYTGLFASKLAPTSASARRAGEFSEVTTAAMGGAAALGYIWLTACAGCAAGARQIADKRNAARGALRQL